MISKVKTRDRRIICVTVLLILGVVFTSGKGNDTLASMGYYRLHTNCSTYLDNTQNSAYRGFLMLSVVKASLSVIEGSTGGVSIAGVGIQAEIGDIVQSAVDTVDFAWRIMLAIYTLLILAEMLLSVSQTLGGYLIGILFFTCIAFLASKWYVTRHNAVNAAVLKLLGAIVIVSLSVSLFLPLSLLLGASISSSIVEPNRVNSERAIFELKERIDVFQGHISGWPGKVLHVLAAFPDILETTESLIRLGVAYTVSIVVIPIGLIFLLYCLTKTMLRQLLGFNEAATFESRMKRALSSYLKTDVTKPSDATMR